MLETLSKLKTTSVRVSFIAAASNWFPQTPTKFWLHGMLKFNGRHAKIITWLFYLVLPPWGNPAPISLGSAVAILQGGLGGKAPPTIASAPPRLLLIKVVHWSYRLIDSICDSTMNQSVQQRGSNAPKHTNFDRKWAWFTKIRARAPIFVPLLTVSRGYATAARWQWTRNKPANNANITIEIGKQISKIAWTL